MSEVAYEDQVGYVGVNLQGTSDQPFLWWGEAAGFVTPGGLTGGVPSGRDLQSNLQALCSDLLRRQLEAEARNAFTPEDACKSLHEFAQSLP